MSTHAPQAGDFLDHPGRPGPFGTLMDEYARAAADFCAVVEGFDTEVYTRGRGGDDEHTASAHALCAHVCGAARRYSEYIRKALGLPHVDRYEAPLGLVASPADVRPALGAAMRYTEEGLADLYDDPREAHEIVTFLVAWGPRYDPEMILEHAIVHLLRHRRQLERWTG